MAKKLELNGVEVFLLPQKAVFIPQYYLLVIADWHLGKLGHFRQEGLFVPPMQLDQEFERLDTLIQDLQVKKVLFLGDLFHSNWNIEWEHFIHFRSKHLQIEFILTKGNHDILPLDVMQQSLKIVDQYILSEGIVFSHQEIDNLPSYTYNIVGHLHPGCVITTKGRQHFRLPCYYLNDRKLTLPAFGKWTGLFILERDRDGKLFAILNDAVLEI